jgi:hypothetical protein
LLVEIRKKRENIRKIWKKERNNQQHGSRSRKRAADG